MPGIPIGMAIGTGMPIDMPIGTGMPVDMPIGTPGSRKLACILLRGESPTVVRNSPNASDSVSLPVICPGESPMGVQEFLNSSVSGRLPLGGSPTGVRDLPASLDLVILPVICPVESRAFVQGCPNSSELLILRACLSSSLPNQEANSGKGDDTEKTHYRRRMTCEMNMMFDC